MSEPGLGAGVEGVGIAYHPLLHRVLLARRDEFDFIELPLDLYIDPAQSALLDPGGARLREIVAAKPCTWRGCALSPGSVEMSADLAPDPSPDPQWVERIRQLMSRTCSADYCDVAGFRRLAGRDLGLPQCLPCTEVAARWIAMRYAAACAAVGHPFRLRLPSSATVAPRSNRDAATFLGRIAALANCEFDIDVTDLARCAAEAEMDAAEAAPLLPRERIATIAISGDSEAEWDLLSTLLGQTEPRAIVIRRTRDLFPVDTIMRGARRAADLIARRRGRVRTLAPVTDTPKRLDPLSDGDPDDLAALRGFQSALIAFCLDQPEQVPPEIAGAPRQALAEMAAGVQSWSTWRARLEDSYKAQQIAQFLARYPGRDGWRRT